MCSRRRRLFTLASQILWKFVPIWRKLNHPNVTVFQGVNTERFQLALIYNWEENGNIMQYMRSHPNTSRLTLVRLFVT